MTSQVSRLSVEATLNNFLTSSYTSVSTTKSIQEWIALYLSNTSVSANYTIMVSGIDATLALPAFSGFKFVVVGDDGTQQYDSNVSSVSYNGVPYNANVYANIGKIVQAVDTSSGLPKTISYAGTIVPLSTYAINENHQTRPEVLLATLSNSGSGASKRISKSSGQIQQYVALRVGDATETNLGTVRGAYVFF